MSKYSPLWEYIGECDKDELLLSFADAERICGCKLDHSFLTYKNELEDYGFTVNKISLKNNSVKFTRIEK